MRWKQRVKPYKKDFLERFKQGVYLSAGGASLEAFINELQKEFEKVAEHFIKVRALEKNAAAKRKVLNITKQHAKKCIEEYSRVQ